MKLTHAPGPGRTCYQGKDDAKAAYHQGQVDLLVPLVKAYGSDQAFRVCETAIQTYGGAGYTRDYPVEQYCRDAKIFSIYEGTNHIQAMDLVGRKLGQARRREPPGVPRRRREVRRGAHGRTPTLGAAVKKLGAAQEAVAGTAMRLLMWFQTRPARAGAALGEPLPRDDERAHRRLAAPRGRRHRRGGEGEASPRITPTTRSTTARSPAALYFARNVLPGVEHKAQLLADEDKSPLDIPDAGFATV